MFLEDIKVYRTEDFYLKPIDTRIYVFFGYTFDNEIFLYFSEESKEEAGNPCLLNSFILEKKILETEIRSRTKNFLYDLMVDKGYIDIESTRYNSDEETKKKLMYIAIRSKKIMTIIRQRLNKLWEVYFNLSSEEVKKIYKIFYRTQSRIMPYEVLLSLRENLTEEQYQHVISDLQKLPVGFCLYIIDKIKPHTTFEDYLSIIKNTPKFIKNCKYRLFFSDIEIEKVEKAIGSYIPKTRIQYFMLNSFLDSAYFKINKIVPFKKIIRNIDLSAWHEFKQYMNLKGPYSKQELLHMLNFISDGTRIYSTRKDNIYNIEIVEVKGSPKKLIQRAIFNHRKEREINLRQSLEEQNVLLPLPPVPLPDWIETIRLKTTHDIIRAGIECEHCIGSYRHSNDVFVREEDVCAQIRRFDLSVGQCYDKRDRITEKSIDFQKRLQRDLRPIAIEKGLIK